MIYEAYEINVQGIVQGVGFRPFIYRLATLAGLPGCVFNSKTGVTIRLQCSFNELISFIECLKKDSPPLAKISTVDYTPLVGTLGLSSFTIDKSSSGQEIEALIPKDTAVCPDCLAELHDPADRRYGYPFINCTNCGPRFSIIESLPYDRPNTSMKSFALCELCLQEYQDPADRRFHAQPVGCWSCGPVLSWHDAKGNKIDQLDCLPAAVAALTDGKIVAIKGLGGFHLAVDAADKGAIAKLRKRKRRPSKPLAIMVKDLATARLYGKIGQQEEEILLSNESPIVLLKKRGDYRLPENLTPGISEIGIMLPYTPLHHLLFAGELKVLVMTSGNRSSEPICIANDNALAKLAGIADFFLLHNREIVTRVDDSVVRVAAGKARILRRSRGYVPEPLALPKGRGQTIGCGAGLKNTFCLTRGKKAFVGQHIGDLDSPCALDFYQESIAHLEEVHKIKPEIVLTDLHPDYLSSRYGHNQGLPVIEVQHHHAHAAAVAAEHRLAGPVAAVVFDGTGLGPDKTVWGGEILYLDNNSYQRLAHIDHLLLPGGDAAAKEPWRMALAMLWKIYGPKGLSLDLAAAHLPGVARENLSFLLQMINNEVNCPKTSSCGRLFDGVAALLNLRLVTDYEGQAAMELEALAWQALAGGELSGPLRKYAGYFPHTAVDGFCQLLDIQRLTKAILADKQKRVDNEVIALKFHLWLIKSVAKILLALLPQTGRRPVVLAGGCMQNRLLLEGLFAELTNHKFSVYAGENIPTNDGGISFGQAVIGGAHVSRNTHEGR